MVELSISNQENVQDKAIGLSFRQKDQLTAEVIGSVFQKVTVKFEIQLSRQIGCECTCRKDACWLWW
jgi:adenine C2-methylase RlmN of 23S rRNA A2503 and tRNA A37